MKKPKHLTLAILLGMLLSIGALIVAFSSVTATHCTVRIKGGGGTVENPLQIEVDGNAGILAFLDSLLPFRGIPCVQLSYAGQKVDFPGTSNALYNRVFLGHHMAFLSIYIVLLILFAFFAFLAVMRFLGYGLAIIKIQSRQPKPKGKV